MTRAPSSDAVDATHRPSWFMLLMEGRAVYDAASMASMFALQHYLPSTLKQGDGHPVLVLPGFLTSSWSTVPLRKFIGSLGYRAHRWKLGYNTGYSPRLHQGMRDRVRELSDRYGSSVSLIGWSLGGVFARELAREMPVTVRQVITMGSPFRCSLESSHARHFFEAFSEVRYGELPREMLRHMPRPPPVPTTALYTRGDGIVAWQGTVEVSRRRDVQNIHVGGAHIGLGFNARSWIAIADRLAQPVDAWQPFEPSGLLKPLFQNWYPDWMVKGQRTPVEV
jgi:pimeloyl-ACP methyl ester carboxylesterase